MHRFFTTDIEGNNARITGSDVRHIQRVLRLDIGDAIVVCDGDGRAYNAVIRSVEEGAVLCHITAPLSTAAEPRCRVTLIQALPKSGKMDLIVQKCVELGVFGILPVQSERCVVQLGEDAEKRRARWQRIAAEAAKQSRRGIVPQVEAVLPLKGVDFSFYDTVLLAYEEERSTTLKSVLRSRGCGDDVALIIGPEGGFSQSEAAFLVTKGAQPVSLGSRILRTETAGMAMLAQLLYEVED